MKGAKGGVGRRTRVRSRVLAGVMLVAASVGVGSAGAASASTATIAPVPAMSVANQQLVPANNGQQGLTLPTKALPALSGTATQVLKGAVANHALDSQNANGYTLSDGASVLQVFSAPVNYQNASGTWVPIDPALSADGSHGLRTGAGPFSVTFPDTWSTTSPITVSVGGGSYSFAVAGMSPAVVSKTAAQAVSYPSVLPDVNVRFWSNTLGYREAVVLGSGSAAVPTFTITAQGLTLTQEPTGEIGLFDSSGKEVGIIPAPRATDASASAVTGLGAEGSASYS